MRLPSTTVTPVLLSFLMPLSATAAEITFAEQFSEGGIPLLIILGLSILFLSVTIERLVHFRVNAVVLQGLMERFKPLWDAGDFAAIERLLLAEVNNITGQAAAGQGGIGGPVQGKGSGVQLSSPLGRMTEFSNSDMPEEATKAYTEWGSHDFSAVATVAFRWSTRAPWPREREHCSGLAASMRTGSTSIAGT